ncbi:MAG TPA: type II CAAX endopeptidase family protein [Candidatus Acidoferrum sp.]|nr:type II CAAX endopeptidase family protein [Candidatus Acidoferrum sp.]
MAVRNEAREIMSWHEEKPPASGDSTPEAENSNSQAMAAAGPTEASPNWASASADSPTATEVASYPPAKTYPEDLQISWSWPHLILFAVFGFGSLLIIQGVLAVVYMPRQRLNTKQLEEYLISKPQFAIGSMLLWYVAIFFFLYVTLSVLRGHPFWRTLGWRKLKPASPGLPKNPLAYFFAGCGLSLFVALMTASMKTPESTPIEELFKYPHTAMMFVAMAVLVAPLVEETLFRGYLYPVFARSFGVTPAILLTGLLFGLMHGSQTGWAPGLVAMLTLVGIVFTLVRARTGTVFASFLMHLGYNLLISLATGLSTHWFTKMPTGK